MNTLSISRQLDLPAGALIFRAALFLSALGLAAYIPYKYATQLHAVSGIYALLFPLSGLLALAGIVVAAKPETACSCGTPMRSGIGALSVLWMVTGVLCVKSLAVGVMSDPAQGSMAMIHMLSQHVFLSLSLLAFAVFPERMVRALKPRLSGHALS